MPINFPSYSELVNRIRSEVKTYLPASTPSLSGSFVRAIVLGLAGRANDIVGFGRQITDQLFPETATGIFLDRWASYEGLTRNPATESSGLVTIIGNAGTSIAQGSQLTSTNSIVYTTNQVAETANQTIPISSLTRSGTTATAVTNANHNLATGMTVTISGVTESEFNGPKVITVISLTSFTYEVPSTASASPGGSPVANFSGVTVTVTSQVGGQNTNLSENTTLNTTGTIGGVDNVAYVVGPGLEGGTDTESDDLLRERVFQSRRNPVANFNSAAIEKQARSVAGVTRVLVKEITPDVGDVTILFLRDGDPDPIPSAADVANVRTAILSILPVTSDDANVFVISPTAVTVNFDVSGVIPSTETMREAVESNILAFFQDKVELEQNVELDPIRGAIENTVDPITGQEITSFVLNQPSSTVTVGDNSIARPGTITVT